MWRDLDWLTDARKVILDVSDREHLANALAGVFDSQIAGGKRYDRAVAGRRVANATFSDSHSVDQRTGAWYALDLTPLEIELLENRQAECRRLAAPGHAHAHRVGGEPPRVDQHGRAGRLAACGIDLRADGADLLVEIGRRARPLLRGEGAGEKSQNARRQQGRHNRTHTTSPCRQRHPYSGASSVGRSMLPARRVLRHALADIRQVSIQKPRS